LVFSLSRPVCFSEDPVHLGHSEAYFAGDFVCRDSLIAKSNDLVIAFLLLISWEILASFGWRLATPDSIRDLFFDCVFQAFLSFYAALADFAKDWETICLFGFPIWEE
jgi:hypothetical protein